MAYNATDGKGRAILVSVVDRVLRLTTFHDVGDDENTLDEVESVWIGDLVGATLRRRRLADRGYQPVLALSFEHERVPGGRLDVDPNEHTEERTNALVASFAELMGISVTAPVGQGEALVNFA